MQYLRRVLEHYFGKRRKNPALMAESVYCELSKRDLQALHNSPEARKFRARPTQP